jgi:hypothetical protein
VRVHPEGLEFAQRVRSENPRADKRQRQKPDSQRSSKPAAGHAPLQNGFSRGFRVAVNRHFGIDRVARQFLLRNFRPSPARFCAQAVAVAGVFAPAYGVAVDNTGGVEIALHVVMPFGERTQFGGDDHARRGGPGLQSK